MRKKISNIFLGLVLIAVGVIYIGNIFELWDFEIFFDGWWTLFIIIPCIKSFITNGFLVSNFIGLGIGVVLLLFAQDVLSFELCLKIIIPFCFICAGVALVLGSFIKKRKTDSILIGSKEVKNNATAIFGGSSPNFNDCEFNGITSSAIFGGVDINLKTAIIKEDCTINCTAIFGGIDIILPSNVKVKLADTSILGGVDNKFISSTDETAPTVSISSTCIFGGLEIK